MERKRIKLTSIIGKYIKNKSTPKRTECEKVLGANKAVHDFSSFYDKQADGLELVMCVGLLEFCTTTNPTPVEIAAYKKAQADIGMMFVACWKEVQEKKKKDKHPAT